MTAESSSSLYSVVSAVENYIIIWININISKRYKILSGNIEKNVREMYTCFCLVEKVGELT